MLQLRTTDPRVTDRLLTPPAEISACKAPKANTWLVLALFIWREISRADPWGTSRERFKLPEPMEEVEREPVEPVVVAMLGPDTLQSTTLFVTPNRLAWTWLVKGTDRDRL